MDVDAMATCDDDNAYKPIVNHKPVPQMKLRPEPVKLTCHQH